MGGVVTPPLRSSLWIGARATLFGDSVTAGTMPTRRQPFPRWPGDGWVAFYPTAG